MLEHSEQARAFYKSKVWRDTREAYKSKVFGLCERCQDVGVIVHHKEYINIDNINDPEVTLNHDNLELLCVPCHNREHHGTPALRDGFRFDAQGKLIYDGE